MIPQGTRRHSLSSPYCIQIWPSYRISQTPYQNNCRFADSPIGYECRWHLSPTIRSWVRELAYIQQMRDNDRTGLDLAVGTKTPGFTAVGIFLFFGAIMASLAATTSSLARHASRSSLGSQSDGAQAARAVGRCCWDSLPAARRGPRHGRNRVVPTPPLGMETSGCNHRHTGSSGCR